MLAAVPIVIGVVFLVIGAGYVLDDWWLRANARFDGAWSVGGRHAGQRPGAVPLWGLVLGVWAGRPVPAILFLSAAGSVFAVCLALLLRRVLPEPVAIAVAFAWAFLPTHTSLEMWVTCVNLAWSQAAAALGLLVGWRRGRRWWHLAFAAGCFAFAVLAYEANIVVAALAVLVLPWAQARRPDWPLLATTGTASALALAWVATHWFEGKQVAEGTAPVHDVLVANTAWPFVSPGATAKLLGVLALGALAFAGGRLALPSFRASAGWPEWMMVTGTAVMLAGTLPFVRYVYEPLGAGDRMNGLSSVGGALFLVGAACVLGRAFPPAAVLVAAMGLAAAGFTRAERMELWHLAGSDAEAIVRAAVAAVPDPDGTLVFGPQPIVRSRIVPFLEGTSISSALQLAYGDRRVRGEMAPNAAAFRNAPAHLRIDIRPVSRLDDER